MNSMEPLVYGLLRLSTRSGVILPSAYSVVRRTPLPTRIVNANLASPRDVNLQAVVSCVFRCIQRQRDPSALVVAECALHMGRAPLETVWCLCVVLAYHGLLSDCQVPSSLVGFIVWTSF